MRKVRLNNLEKQAIKDSGSRQAFTTGAVRDTADGKPKLGLISPIFEKRLGAHLTAGAEKYEERNWEKGIPLSRSMDSLLRHLNAYREGMRDEDHLAAAACNIMFLIHTEEMVKRGLLPEELSDMVGYVAPPLGPQKPELRGDWCCNCDHEEIRMKYLYPCPGCNRAYDYASKTWPYCPQPSHWRPAKKA